MPQAGIRAHSGTVQRLVGPVDLARFDSTVKVPTEGSGRTSRHPGRRVPVRSLCDGPGVHSAGSRVRGDASKAVITGCPVARKPGAHRSICFGGRLLEESSPGPIARAGTHRIISHDAHPAVLFAATFSHLCGPAGRDQGWSSSRRRVCWIWPCAYWTAWASSIASPAATHSANRGSPSTLRSCSMVAGRLATITMLV